MDFQKEISKECTNLQNSLYALDYLFAQMNLNNPTPLNKSAYRGMKHGLELLEKALYEIGKGTSYDPNAKMPKVNNCAYCHKYKGTRCDVCDFSIAG